VKLTHPPGEPRYVLPKVGTKLLLPHWVAKKPHPWLRLEVYKEEVLIEVIPLGDQQQYLFGRNVEVVDVELAHGSISREHSIILHGTPTSTENSKTVNLREPESAHSKNPLVGAVLLDLKSANKTLIGSGLGAEVAAIEPFKFYLLHDGDCIKFGQSTRSYVIKGLKPVVKKQTEVPQASNPTAKPYLGYFSKGDEILTETNGDEGGVTLGTAENKKRKKPTHFWQESHFADEKRKEKFLKLMGAKQSSNSTGYLDHPRRRFSTENPTLASSGGSRSDDGEPND